MAIQRDFVAYTPGRKDFERRAWIFSQNTANWTGCAETWQGREIGKVICLTTEQLIRVERVETSAEQHGLQLNRTRSFHQNNLVSRVGQLWHQTLTANGWNWWAEVRATLTTDTHRTDGADRSTSRKRTGETAVRASWVGLEGRLCPLFQSVEPVSKEKRNRQEWRGLLVLLKGKTGAAMMNRSR